MVGERNREDVMRKDVQDPKERIDAQEGRKPTATRFPSHPIYRCRRYTFLTSKKYLWGARGYAEDDMSLDCYAEIEQVKTVQPLEGPKSAY